MGKFVQCAERFIPATPETRSEKNAGVSIKYKEPHETCR